MRDVERFDAWLYRILMRAAADEVGRRRRYQASVRQATIAPTVSDDDRQVEDRDELERGFLRLSIDHRSVIALHQYLGLPIPQVAQAPLIRAV